MCVCVPNKEKRSKPIADQVGSRKCLTCQWWFKSVGGLTVHKCPPDDRSSCPAEGPSSSACNSVTAVPMPASTKLSLPCCQAYCSASGRCCQAHCSASGRCCQAHCSASGRCCRSKRGFQLHSSAKYNSHNSCWLPTRGDCFVPT